MDQTFIRAKSTNFLEENIGINLYDLGLGSSFRRYDTASNKGKKQVNWTSPKFKTCASKDISRN